MKVHVFSEPGDDPDLVIATAEALVQLDFNVEMVAHDDSMRRRLEPLCQRSGTAVDWEDPWHDYEAPA